MATSLYALRLGAGERVAGAAGAGVVAPVRNAVVANVDVVPREDTGGVLTLEVQNVL